MQRQNVYAGKTPRSVSQWCHFKSDFSMKKVEYINFWVKPQQRKSTFTKSSSILSELGAATCLFRANVKESNVENICISAIHHRDAQRSQATMLCVYAGSAYGAKYVTPSISQLQHKSNTTFQSSLKAPLIGLYISPVLTSVKELTNFKVPTVSYIEHF